MVCSVLGYHTVNTSPLASHFGAQAGHNKEGRELWRRITKDREKAKLLASSHCATQVLGINAYNRGVSIGELYEPETCVMVGLAEFAKCKELKCERGDRKTECLYKAARCYNGGPRSKSEAAKHYAQKFIHEYIKND